MCADIEGAPGMSSWDPPESVPPITYLPPGRVLTHGPAEYDSMRDRIVPMISDALKKTPLLGLELRAWDFMVVPMTNAITVGVAIAVRGVELTGPGKEIMQFRPFTSWQPTQQEIDTIVAATVEGLREARANQASTVNGQLSVQYPMVTVRGSVAPPAEPVVVLKPQLRCLPAAAPTPVRHYDLPLFSDWFMLNS